jgi:hypothetical protein
VAATVTLRVYTGSGAGTESTAQTGIALMNVDSAADSPVANPVTPGSNSFEKWIKLKVESADGQSLGAFWVERTGDLPDGVTIKLGITETATTPTASESSVATTTMAADRRYYFEANTITEDGDTTRFLVIQEQTTGSAGSGDIDANSFTFGWSASN